MAGLLPSLTAEQREAIARVADPCRAYRQEWEAKAIQQEENVSLCQPRMRYYNAPCDVRTIECLLFPKALYLQGLQRLQTLLSARPATGQAKLAWCRRAVREIDSVLSTTNIRRPWIIGGDVPIDYAEMQHIPTFPSAIWPNTNAYLNVLSRQAVDKRSPAFLFPSTFAWNLQKGLHVYHDWKDYATNIAGASHRRATTGSGEGGDARTIGTRGLGALAEQYKWYDWTPWPLDVRRRLYEQIERGAYRREVPRLGDARVYEGAAVDLHFGLHTTGDLVRAYFKPSGSRAGIGESLVNIGASRATLRVGGGLEDDWISTLVPSGSQWENYYRAIAQDLIQTPYEVWVLYGIEQWASNVETWALRGRLALNPEQFGELAAQASAARQRALIGGVFALGAGVAAAANPAAGAVVGAVGLLVDAIGAAGGFAANWFCPVPLTLRSASGDCDFSAVLGPEAQERLGQRGDISSYFGPGAEGGAQATLAKAAPYVAGGAAVVGVGAALYLLLGR